MDQPLIAVRIKDGIFVGNVKAAHDEDFLTLNKCTHVINCAGSEVRDLFQGTIQYLTFHWKDTNSSVCTTVMFDSADRNVDSAIRFIDKALDAGECVLIHSYFGVSRSAALCAAYLMVKYGWNLDNTLSFMAMAHQDMDIKPYFMRQLRTFAKRHEANLDIFDPRVDDSNFALDNEQWMLRNTFINGLVADVQESHDLYRATSAQVKLCEANYKNAARRRRRLMFVDTKQGTSVHTEMTQPLQQPERSHHHVDPNTGASYVVSRNAPDAPPLQPILARRGTPNNHRLEADHAARGAQVLALRPEYAPRGAAAVAPQSANPAFTLQARNGVDANQQQQPQAGQQQQQAGGGSFTLRAYGNGSSSSAAAPQPAIQPSPGANGFSAGSMNEGLPQRGYGSGGSYGGSNPSTQSPVAVPPSASAAHQQQQQQQGHQQQQQQQPPRAGTGTLVRPSVGSTTSGGAKIQNPFTLTGAGGNARRGSPLPKRTVGGGGSAEVRTNSPMARGRPTGTTHPAIAATAGGGASVRANSPQTQPPARRPARGSSPVGMGPSATATGGYGTSSSQPARTGSPLSRGPPQAGSSYYGTSSTSAAASGQRNPTQHNVFSSSGGGGGVTSVPNASATVQRYSYGAGGSTGPSTSVRGAPISAVPSSTGSANAMARPGARGSSPLARRPSSPLASGPSSSGGGVRTGSPLARSGGGNGSGTPRGSSPQRLAEQYLRDAPSASTYGRETHASVLRRESAMTRR